jgi:hypothetical protein
MQRLVHVADEVDYELQRLCLLRRRHPGRGEAVVVQFEFFSSGIGRRIATAAGRLEIVRLVLPAKSGPPHSKSAPPPNLFIGIFEFYLKRGSDQGHDGVPFVSPTKTDSTRPEQHECRGHNQAWPPRKSTARNGHAFTFVSAWSFLIRSSISGLVSTPFSVSSSTRALSVSMLE